MSVSGALRILIGLCCAAGAVTPARGQPAGDPPAHVGSAACTACHADQAAAWQGSHHALAWQLPTGKSVLGDFADAVFEHKDIVMRFRQRGDEFVIETPGKDGRIQSFPVVGVAGIAPLQQYLLDIGDGHVQAFDVAWDVARGRWYHLYPDQELPPGDGLYWTGPYKNWNARCAECHATAFEKNYDPRSRRYASRQAETGVGCEACHGPGGAHVAWASDPDSYDPAKRPALTDKGFTLAFAAGAPEREIQQCAGCHARREPFQDGNPLPGTPFRDAYRLALLSAGLYHADGSIEDEVYVYGSFLQSKMYARGVRCTDCHDPHAARLRAEGNAVCTQCHSPAGNPRFPTLQKAAYDDPAHHFHAPGSRGAQCTRCHMIERVYMGIDGRRDHNFRIPRPDISQKTGAPNACNDCHADRDAAWAAAEIQKWFPDSNRRGAHFAELFTAARSDPAANAEALTELALSDDLPGIVRASALEMLGVVATEDIAARLAPLLEDADPLVRGSAVGVQRGAPPAERVRRLLPRLEDPARSVRIAVAREFLDAPVARLPAPSARASEKVMAEWRASLLAKADFPETHLVLGGAALVMRRPRAAEAAFREAVRLDPQRVEAWQMIVRIRSALGDRNGALKAVEEALDANPQDSALRSMRSQLGAP
ncbi:MAG: tetratricopeptide repeat protein [Rhodospirillales bacterium]|nr:MAG: tetratricopeptide repeat protein [Rhodospirillales bacterium]